MGDRRHCVLFKNGVDGEGDFCRMDCSCGEGVNTNQKYEDILNTVIPDSDCGDVSIRQYLHALLKNLWRRGESFSGKHPFGNSGWEYDLYKGLIIHNPSLGELDEDGYVDKVEVHECDQIIFELIDYIFYGDRYEHQ